MEPPEDFRAYETARDLSAALYVASLFTLLGGALLGSLVFVLGFFLALAGYLLGQHAQRIRPH